MPSDESLLSMLGDPGEPVPLTSDLSHEALRVICAEEMVYSPCPLFSCPAWSHEPTGMQPPFVFSLPDYPSDANASFLLCNEMAKRGYVIRLDNGLDKTWEATFYKPADSELNDSYSPADTAPLAIARAFASATGRAR